MHFAVPAVTTCTLQCGCFAVEADKQPISQWPTFNPPPVPGLPVSVEPDQVNCTGQGFARDPSNCAMYYRCEWGMKHTYVCPEGLHYDSSLKLCNWPHIANCVNRHPASGTHKETQRGIYVYICVGEIWRAPYIVFLVTHIHTTIPRNRELCTMSNK
jgi:hypothetical protein